MGQIPPPVATQAYNLRQGNEADLDDITRIHIDGFAHEPMDDHCYPLRSIHKNDHFEWMRKEYEYYFENPRKYVVQVVDVPEQAEGVTRKIIALAVWNIAVLTKVPALDRGLDKRQDASKGRVEAYIKVASRRYEPQGFFFDWAEKQITLSALTVLPEFRRHGVGTMMVKWGIDFAAEKGWPVTVCASPLGRFLYAHLKFDVIGIEVIQAEGEEDSFSSTAMILLPEE
ncbi:hypothetical protein F5Y04DRAFT_221157 [Hypomontagnella monticulosa]|nr:hypothetical protein F5Y04DRAFT_221157 [Hypomontagnella monticulosa]